MAAAVLGAIALTSSVALGEDRPALKPCREHPQLAGKCFSLRGRMSAYNGAPAIRIWRVGTRRLLGISEGRFYLKGFSNIPPDLAEMVSVDTNIFADFEVCPFEPEQPGVMQLVCVESARNIVVRPNH